MRLLSGLEVPVPLEVQLLLREQPQRLCVLGLVELGPRLYAPLRLLKLVRVMTLWLSVGQQLELGRLEQQQAVRGETSGGEMARSADGQPKHHQGLARKV